MLTFWQDFRFGARMLGKTPGFTVVAILTLALGIGANTAIFSVVNSVLIRSLPVKDPQQLVFLTNPDNQGREEGFGDGNRDFLTYAEFQELSKNNDVLSGLAASASEGPKLGIGVENQGQTSETTPVQIGLVSGSYFSVLGIHSLVGRLFTIEVDEVRDANPVAVVSYRFWRDQLDGSPAALGRKIRIRGTWFEVIGVTPPAFNGETIGLSTEVWVPLSMQPEIYPGRDYLSWEATPFHKIEWLQAIGRLKQGVGIDKANANLNTVFQQILQSQTGQMSARSGARL